MIQVHRSQIAFPEVWEQQVLLDSCHQSRPAIPSPEMVRRVLSHRMEKSCSSTLATAVLVVGKQRQSSVSGTWMPLLLDPWRAEGTLLKWFHPKGWQKREVVQDHLIRILESVVYWTSWCTESLQQRLSEKTTMVVMEVAEAEINQAGKIF